MSISFYDRRKSGDISSRVVEAFRVWMSDPDGTEQVAVLLILIGVTIMMFVQNRAWHFWSFCLCPFLLLCLCHSKVSKRNWRLVREASGDLNSILVEDIQGNRLIHAFALQERKIPLHKIGKEVGKRSLQAMHRWSPALASFIPPLASLPSSGWGHICLKRMTILRLVNFSPFFFMQTCFMSRLDSWYRSTTWFPPVKLRAKGSLRF